MLGAFASLGSSLTWAVGSSAYSLISRTYSPLAVNLCRAIAALSVFTVFILVTGQWRAFEMLTSSEVAWLSLSIVSSYASGDALFLVSSKSLGVPGALAICSSYPILSALAGALFLGQALTIPKILALLLVVGGVILVIASDAASGKTQGDKKKLRFGVVMACITSVFWAFNAYANAQVRPEVPSAVANSIRMSVGIVLCTALIFLTRGQKGRGLPAGSFVGRKEWKKYGWIFAMEGAGGSFLYVYGLTHASLAVASALSALAPAMAVPIAIFWRRERIKSSKVVGVILAVIGTVWLVME